MRGLYSLELAALAKELAPQVEGFRIARFYDLGDDRFLFKLRKGEDRMSLRCMLPYMIGKTEYDLRADDPTQFAIAARKRIEGAVIEKVEQLGGDRILVFKMRKGTEARNMILELFGRGNLVITDGDMRIELAYSSHNFKDRSVRPKEEYVQPGGTLGRLDPAGIKESIKSMHASDPETEALQAITRGAGIGKLYIEEALAQAGVPTGKKLKDIRASDVESIEGSIGDMITKCTEDPEPVLYEKDGIPVDFSLCKIGKYKSMKAKEFDSIQDMLDAFYSAQAPVESVKSREVEELEKSMEKQRALLGSLDGEIEECRSGADAVMRNLQSVNALISFLKQNRHATKAEAQEYAEGIKVLDVNLKDKKVRIEIE